MTRLVLFDIDGTLIHTQSAGVRAFFSALRSEFGIANPSENVSFAGRTDKSLVREFFNAHGIEPSDKNFKRFFENYVFWLDYMLRRSQGEIAPGADHFIHSLRVHKNAPKVGLLTGNIRLGAEIKLRHYYLWEYFEMGVFGDEDEDRNRLASIALQRGRELLGQDLKPEEIVVVGDTVLDVACAKSIGARCLAVCTGGSTQEELAAAKPDWLALNLSKIQAHTILC